MSEWTRILTLTLKLESEILALVWRTWKAEHGKNETLRRTIWVGTHLMLLSHHISHKLWLVNQAGTNSLLYCPTLKKGNLRLILELYDTFERICSKNWVTTCGQPQLRSMPLAWLATSSAQPEKWWTWISNPCKNTEGGDVQLKREMDLICSKLNYGWIIWGVGGKLSEPSLRAGVQNMCQHCCQVLFSPGTFTRFTRFLHDFTWFLRNFTWFLRNLHDFYTTLRNFCDFYAIFCQAQIFCCQAPKTILHPCC